MLYLGSIRKIVKIESTIMERHMCEYIEDFIDYLVLERKLSINTRESYQFDLKEFNKYFSERKIDSLNEQDLLEYLKYLKEEKNLKERSIERHLTTIRSFYK